MLRNDVAEADCGRMSRSNVIYREHKKCLRIAIDTKNNPCWSNAHQRANAVPLVHAA